MRQTSLVLLAAAVFLAAAGCRSTGGDDHWRDTVRLEVTGPAAEGEISLYWETLDTRRAAGRLAPLDPAEAPLAQALQANRQTVSLPWKYRQMVARGDVVHLRLWGPAGVKASLFQGGLPWPVRTLELTRGQSSADLVLEF